jgi:hypothetical protein
MALSFFITDFDVEQDMWCATRKWESVCPDTGVVQCGPEM